MTDRSAAVVWTLLGAPLNSSGTPGGERLAPDALRMAGLVQAIAGTDAGDADCVLTDPVRDPVTGLIGFAQLVQGADAIRVALGGILDGGRRPLVVGGDCTILLGVAAALRDRLGPVGLWFLDGHADFYDGRTSPTGEAADMELAILTGHGPAGLVDLAPPPLVDPRHVVLLGHRRAEDDPDVAEELGYVPDDLVRMDAVSIREEGAEAVAIRVERLMADRVDRAWLHVDLDVLDPEDLPAVSYPQPNGLRWQDLTDLLRTLLASPLVVGMSITDYNPDLDPDRRQARRIVQVLGDTLHDATG